MTISTQTRKTIAAGDGIVTAFNFSFQVRSAADLQIYYTAADGTLTGPLASTLYSVSLNAIPAGQLWSAGGSVTYPLSGSAIAVGTKLTIARSVALLQSTSFINQGNYFPQSMEQAVDLLTMEMQQVLEIANRALVLPIDSAAGGSLPNPIAGYALGWDPTATFITNLADVGNVTIPISIVQGGTGATSASTALTALGGFASTGGVITGDVEMRSTDATANPGPILGLSRRSASPAVNDVLGLIFYLGRNSSNADIFYARDYTAIEDPTAGSEDAVRWIQTVRAGAISNRFGVGSGLYANGASDMGAGTINSAGGFFVTGVRVPDVAADQTLMEAASALTVAAVPGNMKWHPGVAKVWCKAGVTGNILTSYNMTSVTDVAAGQISFTVNTSFSVADWPASLCVLSAAADMVATTTGQAAGTLNGFSARAGMAASDPTSWFLLGFGDQ